MKRIYLSAVITFLIATVQAQPVVFSKTTAAFSIAGSTAAATIYVDENDFDLVKTAAELFKKDVQMVTGKTPAVTHNISATGPMIVMGTIGKSGLVDQLIKQKKLNIDSIKNKWEGYQVQVINNAFKAGQNVLVIAGSDRRGTAYGVFDLSSQIGVSPWYYWADVPVKKHAELYYTGKKTFDYPKVKYRGIFINDEAPALSGWSKKTFGGFNHQFYEKVFELILRLKGNYLWPAMWGNAFNDDDSLNPVVADQYGIVMGTSHHEPLVRAHDEWRRYGQGKWNYDSNATNLQAFWRKGIERMGSRENIVSIGMRGDGDEPMTQGTAIALLEKIVKDQREIIADVTGKPASATPQLWALYKEVQDYYDKGMRVPDDVTLLLCDDNWGNIRKLPNPKDKPHPGGYGIYYHFDYVGGPRNYKWINTNQIERTWEQMHLAYEYGVKDIWIVNVGDIKPVEFPISFFLDYAWDPGKINANDLPAYYTKWSAKQFGQTYAKQIGDIVATYSKYNARRKPELLDANTYSLEHYNEAQRVTDDYNKLAAEAADIYKKLPDDYKDAYFELVLHPVEASANLQNMYTATAYNRKLAAENLLAANKQADLVKQFYIKDSMLTLQYHSIANGKWDHMMDQTHIGYTYWQQPPFNKMPSVKYVSEASAKERSNSVTPTSTTAKNLVKAPVTSNVFIEKDGYVSIEASNYSKAVSQGKIHWQVIPNLGKTGSAITTMPVTDSITKLTSTTPHLEYEIYLYDTGKVTVHTMLSPTLPFHNKGLHFAISIDDEPATDINMHEGYNERIWNGWVANSIIDKTSAHSLKKPGKHTLKYWMIDAGVVLQKLVVDAGGLKQSFLGPPETIVEPNK